MLDRSVTVGVSTVVGFVSGAASAVIPLIGELADASAPLGVDPDVWVVVSAILLSVTVIGRMWQAAMAATVAVIPEPVPTDGGAEEPAPDDAP
jgi:hypothetical protein